MSDLCRLIWCAVIGLFRSQAALRAEIVLLRHQLNVLGRRSPKRVNLSNIDRLVFAGIYSLARQVLDALQIIKPETVIDRLASCWLPNLLALEITAAWWSAEDPP
jgi:hypothetical protein